MARLYFDQLHSTRTRYYFALDSVPGVLTPGVATLTINGQQATVTEPATVFRTPATAVVVMQGLSLSGPSLLQPATAGVSTVGQIPGLLTVLTITPTIASPPEADEQSTAPGLITQMTVAPATSALQLLTLTQNVTQGGNIGFVAPGVAAITIQSLEIVLVFQIGAPANLIMNGLAPTLSLFAQLAVTPDTGVITAVGDPPRMSLPFRWVNDDSPSSVLWVDE